VLIYIPDVQPFNAALLPGASPFDPVEVEVIKSASLADVIPPMLDARTRGDLPGEVERKPVQGELRLEHGAKVNLRDYGIAV
jgi:hypothetical protein